MGVRIMKIEKDVPIPTGNRGRGKYKQLLSQMVQGDSVLCNTAEAQGMRTASVSLGIKIISRAEGQLRRVWRME